MDLTGKTLGHYQIVDEIGRGGMAIVYRAHQASLNRPVAIKVLSGELARDPGFRERFQREAHAVAQLAHPNILPVYDFGEDAGSGMVYFVTQFVDGGTLAARMHTPIPPKEAMHIVAQLANALDYAHANGIVHRDVKPVNVLMLRNDHPLLSDFGIAKIMAETKLTQTGTSMGTPDYMSPEQAQGLPVDHRSDIYALGVMLYAMLSATLPFQADTPLALLHQHAYELPPPLRERVSGISKNLEKIVMRALAKDPDERFATAREFAAALEDEIAGRHRLFNIGRPKPTASKLSAWLTPTSLMGQPSPTPLRTPTRPGRVTTGQKVKRAAAGFGWWLLRTVLSVLIVLLIVGVILLIGAAFALGAVSEQAIASQQWVFDYASPGTEGHIACADIQKGVSQALQPYLLESLTDVKTTCRPPDSVELSGMFRGRPISLHARLHTANGAPAIQLERLNNVPLYVVGGIISDGINRGMVKSWVDAPVRVSVLSVVPASIELVYEANPNAPVRISPSVTRQPLAVIQVENTITRTATIELSGPTTRTLIVSPTGSLMITIPAGTYAYTLTVANYGSATGRITWDTGEYPWVIR